MKVRLVLDTSVVVAALRSRLGASNRVLRKVAPRDAVLLLSPALLLEYEEVLKRPEHRLVHGLTEESVDAFISELAALAEPVEMHFSWRPQSADPGDEMVLETAINGAADVLITLNVRDFNAAERFRIRVVRPGEFLRSRFNE
jgi:putative PIN family toxin of toxin-antitoxin system